MWVGGGNSLAGIKDMVVRGAPAIGVTAAYGVTRAVQDACSDLTVDWELVSQKIATLRATPDCGELDVGY